MTWHGTFWKTLIALPVLPVVYVGALFAAEPLFARSAPIAPVDVIVVLGGDGPARAAKASRVYHATSASAPEVLISGDGDCRWIAALMAEAGVPERSITFECASGNTWENAKFSAPILSSMGARTAILVTSGFHVLRAIACFEEFSPQIEWRAAPVERSRSIWSIAGDIEGFETAKEFLKVPWYVVRYFLPARLGMLHEPRSPIAEPAVEARRTGPSESKSI